jgi:hypothetical protein
MNIHINCKYAVLLFKTTGYDALTTINLQYGEMRTI